MKTKSRVPKFIAVNRDRFLKAQEIENKVKTISKVLNYRDLLYLSQAVATEDPRYVKRMSNSGRKAYSLVKEVILSPENKGQKATRVGVQSDSQLRSSMRRAKSIRIINKAIERKEKEITKDVDEETVARIIEELYE